MSRPTNPLAELVSKVEEEIGAASNAFSSDLQAAGEQFAKDKAELSKKIAELSDAVGIPDIGDNLTSLGEEVGGFFDGSGSSIQSSITDGISTLQETTGAISQFTSDISGALDKVGLGDIAGGLQSAAGAASQVAGVIDDVLSLKRASSIPPGAETFKQKSDAIDVTVNYENDWRVRIDCESWNAFNSQLFDQIKNTGGVVFPYLPEVKVATTAEYSQIEPVHNNYPFQAYKNSRVDDITISGEFSAETAKDADYWLASNLFFRTATKMFFGQGENAGNPPIICRLHGYGTGIFNNVPVVIKNYNVDLGSSTQYVKSVNYNTWVPIVSTVSVTVAPIYNRERLRNFDLATFAKGGMVGYI